jgi:hypothetical protein
MASNSTKTFTYVGVSLFNGKVKARYTNDIVSRIKVMQRGGHVDIQFTELPRAMTKEEIEKEGFQEKALAAYNATKANPAAALNKALTKTAKAKAASKEVPAEQLLSEVGIEVA